MGLRQTLGIFANSVRQAVGEITPTDLSAFGQEVIKNAKKERPEDPVLQHAESFWALLDEQVKKAEAQAKRQKAQTASKPWHVVLGVQKNATRTEVRAAYRRLISENHPDKGGDPETFRGIKEAFETYSQGF